LYNQFNYVIVVVTERASISAKGINSLWKLKKIIKA